MRGRESKDVSLCVFICMLCVCLHMGARACARGCGSASHSLPLFPLRISCIIYGTLMNMLISRRAGRGERASPVLFLHSSDERGKERGMEKRERERWGC